MKKIWILALTLVLTAAMFTGCGCTNTKRDDASTPTGMTAPMQTTLPTEAPTIPATQATRPTIEETTPTGNGAMEDATAGTTGSTDATDGTMEGRIRGVMPGSGNRSSDSGR